MTIDEAGNRMFIRQSSIVIRHSSIVMRLRVRYNRHMILGKRVRLRPLEREDLPRFVRWISDPEIRAHVAQYKPLSLAQEEQWYARNLEAGDTQSWAIDARREQTTTEDPWEHIGVCGYHAIDWRNRSGEVGILIGA